MIESADPICKIVLLGDPQVGKFYLYRHWTSTSITPTETKTTIGLSFGLKQFVMSEKKHNFSIWKINQVREEVFSNRAIARLLLKDSLGAVICYDVTNEQSYHNVQKWLDFFQQYDGIDKPILLVGTKCDKEAERQIPFEMAQTFASQCNIHFIEVSSKTYTNISEAFQIIAEAILQSLPILD